MRGLTEDEVWLLEVPPQSPVSMPPSFNGALKSLVMAGRAQVSIEQHASAIIVVFKATAEGREALRLHRIIKAMGEAFL